MNVRSAGMVELSKRWKSLVVVVAALGLLAGSQTGCSPATAPGETPDEEPRTISVSGSGTVSARPDEVVLRLGVETRAETASEALSENNERMEALIGTLTEAGLPRENIQTETVQLRPQYDEGPQREGRELTGYVASNIVEARTSDLDAIGQLLDESVQAGANRIEGLRFEVSEPGELLDQAREAAWQDAEEKAQQLATLAGVELGDVLSISESTSAPRPVEFSREVEQAAAVPIEPGSQDIQVDLQVRWSVR